jgi:dUTP pyrophosphatase
MKVKLLNEYAKAPMRAHKTDAGFDLYAAIPEARVIWPNTQEKIKTGVAVEIPEGYYGRVADRSSMGSKSIHVLGGVVDHGEIVVMLNNLGSLPFLINKGDKIAQLVVTAIYTGDLEIVESLTETERGTSGFGSTGK